MSDPARAYLDELMKMNQRDLPHNPPPEPAPPVIGTAICCCLVQYANEGLRGG